MPEQLLQPRAHPPCTGLTPGSSLPARNIPKIYWSSTGRAPAKAGRKNHVTPATPICHSLPFPGWNGTAWNVLVSRRTIPALFCPLLFRSEVEIKSEIGFKRQLWSSQVVFLSSGSHPENSNSWLSAEGVFGGFLTQTKEFIHCLATVLPVLAQTPSTGRNSG